MIIHTSTHTLAFYHYTFDVHIFIITSFSAAIVQQYKLMQMAEADHGQILIIDAKNVHINVIRE
jgi:hypothetical protein